MKNKKLLTISEVFKKIEEGNENVFTNYNFKIISKNNHISINSVLLEVGFNLLGRCIIPINGWIEREVK